MLGFFAKANSLKPLTSAAATTTTIIAATTTTATCKAAEQHHRRPEQSHHLVAVCACQSRPATQTSRLTKYNTAMPAAIHITAVIAMNIFAASSSRIQQHTASTET
jgi:hypothetical protein